MKKLINNISDLQIGDWIMTYDIYDGKENKKSIKKFNIIGFDKSKKTYILNFFQTIQNIDKKFKSFLFNLHSDNNKFHIEPENNISTNDTSVVNIYKIDGLFAEDKNLENEK